MNKKIISLILIGVLTLTLTGCTERTNEYEESSNESYYIYIDKETCVEYFVSDSPYNMGNFNPRYNTDGTLKTNKECIYKLESDK